MLHFLLHNSCYAKKKLPHCFSFLWEKIPFFLLLCALSCVLSWFTQCCPHNLSIVLQQFEPLQNTHRYKQNPLLSSEFPILTFFSNIDIFCAKKGKFKATEEETDLSSSCRYSHVNNFTFNPSVLTGKKGFVFCLTWQK